MMGSPSVTTPPSGPSVAVAMTLTAEVRMPAATSGRASGSSTRRTTSAPVMPTPRAASTTSGSTSHAGVGVREDRRDREQHERERDVREARAEQREEQEDQADGRHGAADVGDGHGD